MFTLHYITLHSPSHIRVRALVRACDRGQTNRHAHRHTDARDHAQYISRRLWLTRNV